MDQAVREIDIPLTDTTLQEGTLQRLFQRLELTMAVRRWTAWSRQEESWSKFRVKDVLQGWIPGRQGPVALMLLAVAAELATVVSSGPTSASLMKEKKRLAEALHPTPQAVELGAGEGQAACCAASLRSSWRCTRVGSSLTLRTL